jgi:hypothetical protein
VIIMTVCIADMPSYTYAVKGEKLLKARGYPCEIKRNERSAGKGCTFSLVIHGRCTEALELLSRYSIPFSDIRRKGG